MNGQPGETRDRRERLAFEQKEAWASVSSVLRGVRNAWSAAAAGESLAHAQSIEQAIWIYDNTGRALLIDALEESERARPIRRSLDAIESCDREGGSAMLRESVGRKWLDGAMQLLLGKALLCMNRPWLIWLDQKPEKEAAASWARWLQQVESFEKEASDVLAGYDNWAHKTARSQESATESLRRDHERHLAFWWRRQRSVTGQLALSGGIWRVGADLLRLAAAMGGRIAQERADLLQAMQERIRYLRDWNGGHFDPPLIDARIPAREERNEEWWLRCNAILEQHLPLTLESFAPPLSLPTVFDRPRRLAPRSTFQEALREAGRSAFQKQFSAIMEDHLGIAQEIERTAEVIQYAAEAAKTAESEVLAEAIRNVSDRLSERLEIERSRNPDVSLALVPVIVRATREAAESAGTKSVGTVALRARRRGAKLLRESTAGAAGQAETAFARLIQVVIEAHDRLLVRIGWRTPVRVPVPPVVTRPDLGEALNLDLAHRDLPALYRRLFRLAPVEDARFLVGRQEELNGFRKAWTAWNEGRYAACLVDGARGSGKTSLLNCAIPEVFAGETVVRGQFEGRIASPGEVEQFLLRLLGAEGQDLQTVLHSTRRVVILEEAERVFLKVFGGFEPARRLLEIVHSSAGTTLWILVLNSHARNLLQESVRWSTYFSHTVNSTSVWRQDLEGAILQRHNLSGLKLAFAEPQRKGLKRRLGLNENARDAFFTSLYEQSGGNFRSAFELWQSCVDRVDGGTIQMKQPISPALDGLRKELRQEDHFTLLSVLQHGSLTPDELARVLVEPERISRLRLEKLAALGILQPDPEYPGLRVNPEAQRFVERLLRSLNLI